jgi:hypothetical protein
VQPLPIDIANPEDIRRKLPQAQALYNRKQKELEQLHIELEGLKHLIQSLTVMSQQPIAGGEPTRPALASTNGTAKAPARQLAIEGLRRAGRPMGPTALYRFMQEQNMPVPANSNALGAALWTAAKAGVITKIDGQYSTHRVTDYSKLPIDTPFPVPAGDGQHELPPGEGDQK